ncbi:MULTISPECIES: hypothetical protein [Cryobacterium]|uniref:DUF5134 domain-containing protein n=1 Tax=Cryobacterium breve TaxID=1259258 RepID=A0ABY2J7A0_9MICO|nr:MULTISPECIES: hypothetical protein [Cryobacterium]TFC92099.1 hypothetical protein E3T20_12375 [Cryobacterium sp. TmT3-12]TFC99761.1 hypothetical protein E3O65_05130 [Cryobacterium breve]
MNAIWVSACPFAAVAAAGLGVACSLSGLRMLGRTLVAAPAMIVMAVSCADMVLPALRLLGPLAWAGLLIGSALLALLDRAHRRLAAHHATSLLLMAVMWAVMLSPAGAAMGSATAFIAGTAPGTITAAAGPAAGNGAHVGHALASSNVRLLPAGLVVLVVATSVAVAFSSVRSARRPQGMEPASATLRLESAQHLSMAVAMTLMAAGMFLPLVGG